MNNEQRIEEIKAEIEKTKRQLTQLSIDLVFVQSSEEPDVLVRARFITRLSLNLQKVLLTLNQELESLE